jgi:curved DNA-binding protein CbpA
MPATYYERLRVRPSASSAEIKQAYRKRAKEVHPDIVRPHQRAWAEEEFKSVGEAYEVLSDPKKRAKYDNETNHILNSYPNSRTPASWQAAWERSQQEETINGLRSWLKECKDRRARQEARSLRLTRRDARAGCIAGVWVKSRLKRIRIPANIAQGALVRIKGTDQNYYFRVRIVPDEERVCAAY